MNAPAKVAPLAKLTLSPGPYRLTEDGTVLDADGTVFCVLGHPEDPLTEQDRANGAAIIAIPAMLQALRVARAHLGKARCLASREISAAIALAEGDLL